MRLFRIDGAAEARAGTWTPYLGAIAQGVLHELRLGGAVVVECGRIVGRRPLVVRREDVI
jgi:hypothetical protein